MVSFKEASKEWRSEQTEYQNNLAQNPIKNLSGSNIYLTYNETLVNDGSQEQELTNNKMNCINKCIGNPNCQGVNIITDTGTSEDVSDGYKYSVLPNITCEYVDNISYSNAVSKNPNSTFYAKKNNLQFENNVPYLLNTGNECLSVQKVNNENINFKGVSCNDYNNLTPIQFNTNSDMLKIDSENNLCLSYNGTNGKLNFANCNDYNTNLKFVYDHVLKTIRPFNNTNICIQRDSNNNFVYGECDSKLDVSTTTFENYYKPDKNDDVEYFEQDYTVDLVYYTIYLILLCIIVYLVIMISKKNKL